MSSKKAVPGTVRRAVRGTGRALSYLPRRLLGTITSVDTRTPAVALTFDDGPHPQHTPRFLELLERYGARGTFFLIGQSARRYPALVNRIVEGGHAIGNHSWSHPSFPVLTAAERDRQVRECARAIGESAMRLFRPPYGNQTLASRMTPLRLGWQVVTWSISGTDWRGESADYIAQRIRQDLRPGSIVLLHDALHHYEDERYACREATLDALSQLLETESGRYAFVTVPELLRLGRPRRELWIQPGESTYLAALKGGEASDV